MSSAMAGRPYTQGTTLSRGLTSHVVRHPGRLSQTAGLMTEHDQDADAGGRADSTERQGGDRRC